MGMAASTALPLTQQVAAWLLQGLGVMDRLSLVSRSSAKNALAGELIPQAWDKLFDEVLGAMGLHGKPAGRGALLAALHEADRNISRLDACDLDLQDRMPAVVRALIPAVGVRFGELAAIIDQGVFAPVVDERGRPLPVGDWLCDPLNPATFGRAAEVVLRSLLPKWTGWGGVAESLEAKGVASRKTVSRWRSGELYVPNVANVVAVAGLAPAGASHNRVLVTLRVARLLAATRRALSREWGDALLAEETASAVASWARVTRHALAQPGVLADLAEYTAVGLESRSGANLHANLAPMVGAFIPFDSPARGAAELRARAVDVRRSGDPASLRWLVLVQVLMPHPLLTAGVGSQLGIPPLNLLVAGDWVQPIQEQWRVTAFLRMLSRGEGLRHRPAGSMEPVPFVGSPALREQAARLVERARRVVRRAGDESGDQLEDLRFAATLLFESGGDLGFASLADTWNEASRRMAIPAGIEVVAPPELLAEAPHLLPARARRLAAEGDAAGALACVGQWASAPGNRTWADRLSVADAYTILGNQQVDRLAPLRVSIAKLERLESSPTAAVVRMLKTGHQTLTTGVRVVGDLLAAAERLLGEAPDPPGRAARVTTLFPLALRLAALDGCPAHLLVAFGDEIDEAIRQMPTDGGLWAVLALRQAAEGTDDRFALRQAAHFGAGDIHARLAETLRRDREVDQG